MSDGFSNGPYQGGMPASDRVAQGIVFDYLFKHKNPDTLQKDIEKELDSLIVVIKRLKKKRIYSLESNDE